MRRAAVGLLADIADRIILIAVGRAVGVHGLCELVLPIVGIAAYITADFAFFACYVTLAIVGILKPEKRAATAVFIIEMLHLRGSVIPAARIIPKCSGKHRRAVYFGHFAVEPVELLVVVVNLYVRRISGVIYFKPRQQSGRIAVGICLARRSGAVIPRLTRQAVGLVVDVLCTLGERAVVILAAADEALCTPDDIFPPGYCFFRAEVCCQFSLHSVGIIWYKFKYNF